MRKPQRDDRWDRTPGNLFLPKRPTLPTRRYVMGLLGGIKDCCGEDLGPCGECTNTPHYITITFSNLGSGYNVEDGVAYTAEWSTPTAGEGCRWVYGTYPSNINVRNVYGVASLPAAYFSVAFFNTSSQLCWIYNGSGPSGDCRNTLNGYVVDELIAGYSPVGATATINAVG